MEEKKKGVFEHAGWYALATFGGYIFAAAGVYGVVRFLERRLRPDDVEERMRRSATDTDPKDGTPLFIGS